VVKQQRQQTRPAQMQLATFSCCWLVLQHAPLELALRLLCMTQMLLVTVRTSGCA
jgi:hypothetical protein